MAGAWASLALAFGACASSGGGGRVPALDGHEVVRHDRPWPDADAWVARALGEWSSGRVAAADASVREALALEPEHAQGLIVLARVLGASGAPETALEVLGWVDGWLSPDERRALAAELDAARRAAIAGGLVEGRTMAAEALLGELSAGDDSADALRAEVSEAWLWSGETGAACRVAATIDRRRLPWHGVVCEGAPADGALSSTPRALAIAGLLAAGRRDEGLALAAGASEGDLDARALRAIGALYGAGLDAVAGGKALAEAIATVPEARAVVVVETLFEVAVERRRPELIGVIAAALLRQGPILPADLGATLAMSGVAPDEALVSHLGAAFGESPTDRKRAFIDGLRAGGAPAVIEALAVTCGEGCAPSVRLALLEASLREGRRGGRTAVPQPSDLKRIAAEIFDLREGLDRGERVRLAAAMVRLGVPADFRLEDAPAEGPAHDPARVLDVPAEALTAAERLGAVDGLIALGARDLAAAMARERGGASAGGADAGVASLCLDAELVRLSMDAGDESAATLALERLLGHPSVLPPVVLARLGQGPREPATGGRTVPGRRLTVLSLTRPGRDDEHTPAPRAFEDTVKRLVQRALPRCVPEVEVLCRPRGPSALRQIARRLRAAGGAQATAERRAAPSDAGLALFEAADVLRPDNLPFQVSALGAFVEHGRHRLAALTAAAIAANLDAAGPKADRRLLKRAADLALSAGLADTAWAIVDGHTGVEELRMLGVLALARSGRRAEALDLARSASPDASRRGRSDEATELAMALAAEGAHVEALTLAVETLDGNGARSTNGAAALELARRSLRPEVVEAVCRRLLGSSGVSSDTWERSMRVLLEAGLVEVALELVAQARKERPGDGSLRDLHLTAALAARDTALALSLLDEVLADRRVRGQARLLTLRRVAASGMPDLWRQATLRAGGDEAAWRVAALSLGGDAAEAVNAAQALLASEGGAREAALGVVDALAGAGRMDLVPDALASSLGSESLRGDLEIALAKGWAAAGDLGKASQALVRLADEGGAALLDTIARIWWEAGEGEQAAAVWADLLVALDAPFDPASMATFASAVAESGPPPGLARALRVRAAANPDDAALRLGLVRVALEAGLADVAVDLLTAPADDGLLLERARLSMAAGRVPEAVEAWLARIDLAVSTSRGGRSAVDRALPQALADALARIDALEPPSGPTRLAVLDAVAARTGTTRAIAAHRLLDALVAGHPIGADVESAALARPPSAPPDPVVSNLLARIARWTGAWADPARHRLASSALVAESRGRGAAEVTLVSLALGGAPEAVLSVRGHDSAALAARLGPSGVALLARAGFRRLAAEAAQHAAFRTRAGVPAPLHRAALWLAAPEDGPHPTFNPFDDAVTAVHVALALGDVGGATAAGLPLLRASSPHLDVASERLILAAVGATGDPRTIDRALDLLEVRPAPGATALETALRVFEGVGADLAAARARGRLVAAGAAPSMLRLRLIAEGLGAPGGTGETASWSQLSPRDRLEALVAAMAQGALLPDDAQRLLAGLDLPDALAMRGGALIAAFSGDMDSTLEAGALPRHLRAKLASQLSRLGPAHAATALRLTDTWPDAPRVAIEARARAALELGDAARVAAALDVLIARWPSHLVAPDLLQAAFCRAGSDPDTVARLMDYVLRQPPGEVLDTLGAATLGTATEACPSGGGAPRQEALARLAARLAEAFGPIDGDTLKGALHRFTGDIEAEAAAWEALARRAPRSSEGRLARARLARLRGDLDAARRDVDHLLRVGAGGTVPPESLGQGAEAVRVDALILRAQLERDEGERVRARGTLAAARAITPDSDATRHASIALALAELGPEAATRRELAVCRRLVPGLPACRGDRDDGARRPSP